MTCAAVKAASQVNTLVVLSTGVRHTGQCGVCTSSSRWAHDSHTHMYMNGTIACCLRTSMHTTHSASSSSCGCRGRRIGAQLSVHLLQLQHQRRSPLLHALPLRRSRPSRHDGQRGSPSRRRRRRLRSQQNPRQTDICSKLVILGFLVAADGTPSVRLPRRETSSALLFPVEGTGCAGVHYSDNQRASAPALEKAGLWRP
jgi:hypothetical protein